MWNRLFIKEKIVFKDNNLADFDQEELDIINQVQSYTMTSKERLVSLIRSIKYLQKNRIEGDFVECGVWKGGSVMAMILAIRNFPEIERKIWLYDTFQGMTPPKPEDLQFDGLPAKTLLDKDKGKKSNIWAVSSLEEVKSNIGSLNYSKELLEFVQGPVEETIPKSEIGKISLLRLDTDWYESTKLELEILFPKLVKGGILIIDDYGHWKGCKKAVDEYLDSIDHPLFLSRIDYTGRLIVKNCD